MNRLSAQRCLNPPAREAAARCPSCGHFFCRECVTEHDGKVICARCLAALARTPARPRRTLRHAGTALAALGGLVLLWLCFFLVGKMLLTIPTTFHDAIWLQGES
jgi:hypothetical protein